MNAKLELHKEYTIDNRFWQVIGHGADANHSNIFILRAYGCSEKGQLYRKYVEENGQYVMVAEGWQK